MVARASQLYSLFGHLLYLPTLPNFFSPDLSPLQKLIEVASSEGAIAGGQSVTRLKREDLDKMYLDSFDIDYETSEQTSPEANNTTQEREQEPAQEPNNVTEIPEEELEWDRLTQELDEDGAVGVISSEIDDLMKQRKAHEATIKKPKGKSREEKIRAVKDAKEQIASIDEEIKRLERIAYTPEVRRQRESEAREESTPQETTGESSSSTDSPEESQVNTPDTEHLTEETTETGEAEEVQNSEADKVGEAREEYAKESEEATTQADEPQPIGHGAFGAIYDQFRGKAKEAIEWLKKIGSGEALGALHHKDIGEIDLVWGKEGTAKSDGFGLSKLLKYHPEVVDSLQEIISSMKVVSRSENRIQLESEKHKASVRLSWDNEKKTWLLTAFEKKETSAPASSSADVASNSKSRLDDTTTQPSADASKKKQKKNSATTLTPSRTDSKSGEAGAVASQSSSADKGNEKSEAQNNSPRASAEEAENKVSEDKEDKGESKEPIGNRQMSASELQEARKRNELLPQEGRKGKEKGVIAEFLYTLKDSLRAVLTGVYYDAKAKLAVASNAKILLAEKREYDPKQKGKIINPKSGEEIKGKYPPLEIVFSSLTKENERGELTDLDSLSHFLDRVEAYAYEEYKKSGKGTLASYRDNQSIEILHPDGSSSVYSFPQMRKVLAAAKRLSIKSLKISDFGDGTLLLYGQKNGSTVVIISKGASSGMYDSKFLYEEKPAERSKDAPKEVEEAQSDDTINDTITSEAEAQTEATFLDAIKTLYDQGKAVASKAFGMKFFEVARTSDLLKELGLTGEKFTVRYGVLSRHFGKDKQHDLPLSVWEQLPEALNKPLIVSKYYTPEGKQKGYRIYTSIQLEDGSFVMVSAEVKNAGRDIEVNTINTVFGRQAVSSTQEEVIYTSNEMTPEQRTLLNGTNPHQYSATQESSSADKDTTDSADVQAKEANSGEFGLVSDARMEELKARLKKKLLGQVNSGVDPEVLAIGLELAVGYLDRGAKRFADFTKVLIEDLGDEVRPYLKAFYNGARDMPQITENAIDQQMDSYDSVKGFDTVNFGKEKKAPILEQAKAVAKEQEAQREVEKIDKSETDNDRYSIKKQHNDKKDVDIWVVRGKEHTERDVFLGHKKLANNWNGYYSSFRGVNGFVFEDPEDARKFAEEAFGEQQAEEETTTETNESKETTRQETSTQESNSEQDSEEDSEDYSEEEDTDRLDEPTDEYPFKIGDTVMYQGKEAKIFDIEEGRPIMEISGLSPVVYVLAHWEDLSPVEGAEKKIETDSQGNPINEDGSLKTEEVQSVDEITDEDFNSPSRNVLLPKLPKIISEAIGAFGKRVVIKKNIFEKNKKSHSDLEAEESRKILNEALYNPTLYGQNQKATRPYNWILIHSADKSSAIILEVSDAKDHLEIVNWHYLNEKQLEQKKRQAEREGGHILTLASAVGNTSEGLSSESKDTKKAENAQNSAERLTEEQVIALPRSEQIALAIQMLSPQEKEIFHEAVEYAEKTVKSVRGGKPIPEEDLLSLLNKYEDELGILDILWILGYREDPGRDPKAARMGFINNISWIEYYRRELAQMRGEKVKDIDTLIEEAKKAEESVPSEEQAEPKQKEDEKTTKAESSESSNENAKQLNDNGSTEELHVRPSTTASKREGGHEPRQNESVGTSAGHQAEQSDQRRVDRRDSAHPSADTVRSGRVSELPTKQAVEDSTEKVEESAPKAEEADNSTAEEEKGIAKKANTNNWREEKGQDASPKTDIARTKANIEAIRTLKQIQIEGREATPEEKARLAQFTGWGGLGVAFADGSQYLKELQELLSPEELESAQRSRLTAYYTPPSIIDKLWDLIKHLGFKGGNILEGSAGIGGMLARMPKGISDSSRITAVEIDEITGGILELLYPDALVDIQGFEKTHIPVGSVDLAITNVPFVTGLRVHDSTGHSDLSSKFKNIHDFCIAKNVRMLRAGGIGVFITTSGTLDDSRSLRLWLSDLKGGNSDVVGAFRLNNATFIGAPVTSDIIIIRKRLEGEGQVKEAIDITDTEVVRSAEYEEKDTKGNTVKRTIGLSYNRYFVDHPEYMGGEMKFAFEEGETYRATSKGLYPISGKSQDKALDAWIRSFKGKSFKAMSEEEKAQSRKQIKYSDGLSDKYSLGEVFVDEDGSVMITSLEGDTMVSEPLGVNSNKVKGFSKQQLVEDYRRLKGALKDLIQSQLNSAEGEDTTDLRKALNEAYDTFVGRYGRLNKNASLAFLRNDIDFPSVQAIERYEEKGDARGNKVGVYSKTDIFNKRIVSPAKAETPKNPEQAVRSSLLSLGRVDLGYIAKALSISNDQAKSEALATGLAFEDPSTGRLVSRFEYLSGNVRAKLKDAEKMNQEGKYNSNVQALKGVIPQDIPAHLLPYSFGATWIPARVFEQYIYDVTQVKVHLSLQGGAWIMSTKSWVHTEQNISTGVFSSLKGEQVLGTEIMETALNLKDKSITKTRTLYTGEKETVSDKEAMAAIADRADEFKQNFAEWIQEQVQSDSSLADELTATYNETMNNYVPFRMPDNFVPTRFEGASESISLRPHQAKAAIRATTQPVLLAHEVGTGKTFTMISAAMEMRRLGTAKKPLIVVQNATVGQFVASAKQLYPQAKILTMNEQDKGSAGRRRFYAQMMYNDWDMIIISQSAFERIPDSEARQIDYIQDKIQEKMSILETMRQDKELAKSVEYGAKKRELQKLQSSIASFAQKSSKDAKQEAKARENAKAKVESMLDRETEDTYTFDDLGVDALLIDEAHEYKHLGFETAMARSIKGVDPSFSKKSQGLYLKVQSVFDKAGRRNVLFATGTPISNTAAEIWTFMRYLMPKEAMEAYGISTFDNFTRNYGQVQSTLEFGTDGTFKQRRRFVGYSGLSELVRIWSQVADTVLAKDSPEVQAKLPDIEGGKANDVFLPQTKGLRSVMKLVNEELEKYNKMSGAEKKQNGHIPVVMYGVAKAAAIDPRLVDSSQADDPNTKTNETVRQTIKSLEETKDYKGTVAIFSDLYQNKKSGFNLYQDIKDKLVAQGVPEEQIVIIKSGMKVEQKQKIFDKVNSGEVRVIIGSTATLGTGVNIQERLHTLIHIDAPNRPMDYTQRNGRIIRQGNLHKDMGKPVRILRFGVEDSLDVTAYQRLKTKGAIADSVMNGQELMDKPLENRSIEEEGDNFGDMVAVLSGSEYAVLKNQAEKDLRKLELKYKQWQADQKYIQVNLPLFRAEYNRIGAIENGLKKGAETLAKAIPEGKIKSIKIGKKTYKTIEELADFTKDYNKSVLDTEKQLKDSVQDAQETKELTIEVNGIEFKVNTNISVERSYKNGGIERKATRSMRIFSPSLGIDEPVKKSLITNVFSFISDDLASGKYYAEKQEQTELYKQSVSDNISQMEARISTVFSQEEELEKARNNVATYTELMSKELEAKEAKYKDIDSTVEASAEVSFDNDEDEAEDNRYRSASSDGLDEVNDKFNEELQGLTEGNADSVILSLGMPSDVLRSAGVSDKTMRLYGNKVIKKMKKHGFSLSELKDLPRSVANPIAVFDNYRQGGNRTILTELHSQGRNIVVAVTIGKAGVDVDFNIVSSVFGKGYGNIIDWLNKGYATYIDKEKALDYLHFSERSISEASDNQELSDATKVIQDFENPSIPEGENENIFSRAEEEGGNNAPEAQVEMRSAVEELASDLAVEVKIVDDIDSLPEGSALRSAKGWYNVKTGKVTVVLPNNADVDDAVATILHEVIGHKGIRELVGDKQFDTFLDKVLGGIHSKALREIHNEARKIYDQRKKIGKSVSYRDTLREATEEYIARLAEGGFSERENRTTWQKIVDLFRDLWSKAKIALGWNIQDRDIRYILWKSYQNRKQQVPILREAGDIAMRHRLGIAPKENNQQEDVRYRNTSSNVSDQARKEYNKRTRITALDKKTGQEKKSWRANIKWRLREAYQDSMLSLKELQDVLSNNMGRQLEEWENAYTEENLMSSKNKSQTDLFEVRYGRKITDELGRLQKAGASYQDIVAYMIAKHGLERNAYYNKLKEEEARVEWDAKEAQKQQAVPAYTPKPFVYQGTYTDYSGLTDLTQDDQHFTQIAEDMVRHFESKYDTKDLWARVNDATKATIAIGRQKNLISKRAYDEMMTRYQYYIPLRGWDRDKAEDIWDYISSSARNGRSGNTLTKKAKGRKSLADDPIATIFQMAEDTIRQGNRNVMKLKFLNLAQNAQDPLLLVYKTWWVKDPTTQTWAEMHPTIPADSTSEESLEILQDFEESMNALRAQGLATQRRPKGTGVDIDQDMHATQAQRNEHIVTVYRGGESYSIYVNGNPRAAQAINGQLNISTENASIEGFYQTWSKFNRIFANLLTSWNPNFIVKNGVKDLQHALAVIGIKESDEQGYLKSFLSSYAQGLKDMTRLLKAWNTDSLDLTQARDKAFYDFMLNGGETGYTIQRKLDEYKGIVEGLMAQARGEDKTNLLGKVWQKSTDLVDLLNSVVELNTRFATFSASRAVGRSMERSISDAKNITVNFNKKGTGGYGNRWFREGYVFFNASVQAANQVYELIKNKPKRTLQLAAEVLALGIALPLVAMMAGGASGGDGDGDDDKRYKYFELNEHTRRNNIILPDLFGISEDGFFSIPLPPLYKAIYAVGEQSVEMASGELEPLRFARDLAPDVFSSYSPLDVLGGNDGDVVANLVPTLGQPIYQAKVNRNYFGEAIYRESPFNRDAPEWTKTKDANPLVIELAKALNSLSGGDKVRRGAINVNPELAEHLVESYTGGVGKFANMSMKTAGSVLSGEAPDPRNIPIVGQFYKKAPSIERGKISNKVYRQHEDYKELERIAQGYEREIMKASERRDKEEYKSYRKKLRDLYESPEYKRLRRNDNLYNILLEYRNRFESTEDEGRKQELIRKMKGLQKAILSH